MTLRLRLYLAGEAPNSVAARENLRALLERSGNGDAELEIVDVFATPERALEDGVVVTPTLLRLDGTRPVRVVGALSCAETTLRALGLRS